MALTDTPPTATPRQRRKEARPQELLDAALELFVEKGFAATRSEEVAVRAGVSKGTLYLYYPSKEELLKAVIRENISAEIAEGEDIVRAFEGPTTELLPHLIHEWWRRIGETKASGICKIILSEVRNFPDIAQFYLEEVIEPAERMIASVIERGIARGEFRPVPVHETVHALIAPILFMMLHKNSIGACPMMEHLIDPPKQIAVQMDLMLHGLCPREPVAAAAQPAARKAQGTR
ncbi:MAG TPA: TetR/AcrR family transcriptional regulator [Methylibium sp.]|nr:TetR/AcrR family transcriptional regulator [Methylibium sp.]